MDKMFSHDLSDKTSSVTLENGVIDKILENYHIAWKHHEMAAGILQHPTENCLGEWAPWIHVNVTNIIIVQGNPCVKDWTGPGNVQNAG